MLTVNSAAHLQQGGPEFVVRPAKFGRIPSAVSYSAIASTVEHKFRAERITGLGYNCNLRVAVAPRMMFRERAVVRDPMT